MTSFFRVLSLIFILGITGSFSLRKLDYRKAMHKNVCKELHNSILMYFIFVDTRTTSPWTEFDIRTTLDSIQVARKWLLDQAEKYHIPLTIQTDYYIGKDYATISRNLPYASVYKSATTPSLKKGLKALNSWADWISKRAGQSIHVSQEDGIPEIKNPRNKERLIAYLRDTYKVESVALFFMVNNYYKTDISLPLNTMSSSDVEFAIISYKYPADIAHNLLNLYGAADLYKTLYRRNDKKINVLSDMLPNDIMQDPYAKSIWHLDMSAYTRYLIGWQDTIAPKWNEFFIDKRKNY